MALIFLTTAIFWSTRFNSLVKIFSAWSLLQPVRNSAPKRIPQMNFFILLEYFNLVFGASLRYFLGMSEIKYRIVVENAEVISEEGNFFKALPFELESDGRVFACVFRKSEHGHVVYEVSENGTVILELEHPDYLPELAFSDLDAEGQKLLGLYAALLHVGIGKAKWQDYSAVVERAPQSFVIRQLNPN